tara:strand:- start:151 stop:393 length:243 start_codon:yes stop_codon:yes gene_type:complete
MENERRTQLNINIDAKLLKSLKLKSIIEDKTLSEYIVNILESYENDNHFSNSSSYETKLIELDSRIKEIEEMINLKKFTI